MRILILLCLCALSAHAQSITTLAGNGIAGYSGDGNPAVSASLNQPFGIACSSSGDLYLADRANNRIRKVSATGIISTVAGNGTAGYSGDNGPATDASIKDPVGVATDASGNLYLTDRLNQRIRKVDAFGTITTIAGNGTAGFSGDNAPATAAMLNDPRGLATDAAGNIYIADRANQRIRKVDAAGTISTIAGNGTMGYSGDGGPATAASFNNPYSIAIDNAGYIYIADVDNERIRKIDATGIITTVAGNGIAGFTGDNAPATAAMLNEPIGITTDNAGRLYIADGWNNKLRMVSAGGIISTIAGNGSQGFSGDGGPANYALLYNPYGIAVNSAGNIFIADNGNNRIRFMAQATAVDNLSKYRNSIYPNPAHSILHITATGSITSVTVVNIQGQIVFCDQYNSKDLQIDVSAFPPGIYSVLLNGTDRTLFVKD